MIVEFRAWILFIVVLTFWVPAVASPGIDKEELRVERSVVRIAITQPGQLSKLAAYVEPWGVHDDYIVTDLSSDMLERLRAGGYEIEILHANREALYRQEYGMAAPSLGEDGLYHTYAETKLLLEQLESNYPGLAQVVDIGDSWEKTQGGADHDILALRISDNVGQEEGEPEILFVGTHHAREWISVEVPLYLADHLLTNYAADPAVRGLIDNGDIWIVPMVNPDGHQYSVDVDRWWRKNRRQNEAGDYGVDLNRNYGYMWGGPGSSGFSNSDIYRGTAPFSEPETDAVRNLGETRNFRAVVSYHSFGQLILHPWSHSFDRPPEKDLMRTLAEEMAGLIYDVHGEVYTPQQGADLYPASGTTDDWFYGELGVIGNTIELRPTGYPAFELPENEILPTCEENLPAALHMIGWSQLADPLPDLKANGQDGPLTISRGDRLQIEASLKAGNRDDIPGDWWLAAATPMGWYHFDMESSTWLNGLKASHTGPLADQPQTGTLDTRQLPRGEYKFYFGVETNANQTLDQEILFLDSLGVTVNSGDTKAKPQ